MHAYKLRPDADYVDQTRGRRAPARKIAAIDGDDDAIVAHPSPARAMQAALATQLQPDAWHADDDKRMSARSQLAVIVGGSTILWMPIAGAAWAIFG